MAETENVRSETRCHEFNCLMIECQLGLAFAPTYGDFLDTFGHRMRVKTGDYTQEDEAWALESLERFVKRNAMEDRPKKKKNTKTKTATEENKT